MPTQRWLIGGYVTVYVGIRSEKIDLCCTHVLIPPSWVRSHVRREWTRDVWVGQNPLTSISPVPGCSHPPQQRKRFIPTQRWWIGGYVTVYAGIRSEKRSICGTHAPKRGKGECFSTPFNSFYVFFFRCFFFLQLSIFLKIK